MTFTATRAGTFQFHSGEGDDEKLGMVGTFTVLAPGALPGTGEDPRQPWLPGAVAGLGALLAVGGLIVRRRGIPPQT